MTQKKLLSILLKKNSKAIIVCSLGTISYDVTEIVEKESTKQDIYFIRGAMGCAIGAGLGLALSQKKKVVVFIGDGSYNMKAGSVSTVMKYKPKNLFIYIMQNKKYASTGNQDISSINPLPPKSKFKVCKVT